jgi:hypothetical protein
LISTARFPPLAAASLTVLLSAGGDAYTDSGRTLGRVIGIIALRSAMPGVPWSEIIRIFESGQSGMSPDLQSKQPSLPPEYGIFGKPTASISESSSNDSSKSKDSGS